MGGYRDGGEPHGKETGMVICGFRNEGALPIITRTP